MCFPFRFLDKLVYWNYFYDIYISNVTIDRKGPDLIRMEGCPKKEFKRIVLKTKI